ncbi:MAG: phytanoyl-CoA dioxygenase family protein [Henriciella sp.]|nr:phytanoyl-CoA dioxygenase family protein [Henriciella sp.]
MIDLNTHKDALTTWGVTKLRRFLPVADPKAARALIYEVASDLGVYAAGQWQNAKSRFDYPKPFRAALNALNHSPQFPNMIDDQLIQVVEALLGEPVTALAPGQQILFSLPGKDAWFVPGDLWHVDLPRFGGTRSPGLQMFTFLDGVEQRGGGTLVLAGSHRLKPSSRTLRSKQFKQELSKEPYFRILFDKDNRSFVWPEDAEGTIDGVDLRVIELTGEVGDVYLMDLRVLHTLSLNVSNRARIMLTCRFPKTSILPSLRPSEFDRS